jgi:hypothetical protein
VAEEFNTGRITHGPLGIAVEAHVGGHGQICGVARTDPRRSATQTCVNASTPNAGSLAAADDKPTRIEYGESQPVSKVRRSTRCGSRCRPCYAGSRISHSPHRSHRDTDRASTSRSWRRR